MYSNLKETLLISTLLISSTHACAEEEYIGNDRKISNMNSMIIQEEADPIELDLDDSSLEDESFDDELEEEEVEEENIILNSYNRGMTSFNDGFYMYTYEPVSSIIDEVVPKPMREGLDNMFENIKFPIRFVNSVLQFKFVKAGEEFGKFFVNTTAGLLGFYDVAGSEYQLSPSPEDFGQTLGFYGFGSGPHIVLPFLGPSNLRDVIGIAPDMYLNPSIYLGSRPFNLYDSNLKSSIFSFVREANYGSINYKTYGGFKEDAIDLYPYLKDVYTQHREELIKR